MADKTPKVKPVPAPNNSPDFSIDVAHRPPPPTSAAPQISMPNRLEPSHTFSRPDLDALTQENNISATPISFAIDELAIIFTSPSLTDYRIPTSTHLGDADAQGIRRYKGRQFVEVADNHFVQVVLDAESGLFRVTQSTELNPSGPLLKRNGEGRFWHAVDSGGGQALQQLIRPQPLPSRQAVSEILELVPLRATVDSADMQYRQTGRLRGGADSDPAQAKSIAKRVRDLYPLLTDEEVKMFINERLRSDPYGLLKRLEKEFQTLRQELKVWSAEIPPPPGAGLEWTPLALAEQLQLRQHFSENLQAIWQQKSITPYDSGGESFSSFIDFSGELPNMTARFEYVTELALEARNPNVKLGKLLDSFPNVRYLILEKVRMEAFAPGIFQMRNLRHLVLRDCSLRLSDNDADGLARIETLTLLRLDENPLGVVPHLGFMRQLEEVYLSDTGLVRVPSGVEQLENLKLLDLHDNNIVDIREELFEIPDTQNLFVNLIGNPLGESARFRIDEYLQGASMDSKIDIRTREPVFDDVSDLSDSSDSGVDSESD
ncbi:leucine-rich repeat domain-containing protein [Pseudomonas gozinkensis]|uniref:leucine-rich repeat domain-containing protein n=1 Tax=Pseudomonas gozinkensis TaxID=2774461 RepID=UPI001787BB83|nr:leucine-rich repeat domain-containing protein [Pseudomonas gozinkensis]